MTSRRLPALVALAIAIASSAPKMAYADERAERLFRDGRALYEAGSYERACAKFAESQSIEPSAGTALNLGDCYEKLGKVSSAYAAYKEAAVGAALRKRSDWEQFAVARIASIKGLVPTVTIRLPTELVDGLVVLRDGRPLAATDGAIEDHPDPGAHVIEARAPGRVPWSQRIDVKTSATYVVEIPRLDAEPAKSAPPTRATTRDGDAPRSSTEDEGASLRTLGLVAGGIGAAGLLFGTAAGMIALDAKSEASGKCPSYPDRCTREGTDANDRAQTWATVSTVGFVAGAALLVGGAVIYLTAPSRSSSSARASLHVGPASTSLRLTF